jgi:diadenylate cyclase
VTEFFNDLLFIFQRLNGLSVIDILLVTLIFFILLYLVRDTQAMTLLRGVMFLFVLLALLTTLVDLPAFSWLVQTALPAMLLAIPVIFAPEIRRALERLGRAGTFVPNTKTDPSKAVVAEIQALVAASARLASRQHGALIIIQRFDNLDEYVRTGTVLNARITPDLLLQIFYPNTPLHDGAVIVQNGRVAAAACVMPLSASGVLGSSVDRKMGLRHRAALGTSEASDAVAIVVSEETGSISIAHSGKLIRKLEADRLEQILYALLQPDQPRNPNFLRRHFPYLFRED